MSKAFDRFKPTRRFDLGNINDYGPGEKLRYSRYGDYAYGGPDSLGIGASQRAREDNNLANLKANRDFLSNPVGPSPTMTRFDPLWTPMLQTWKEENVGAVRGGSRAGTSQIAGLSSQPDYLTTGETFKGRPNLDYKSTLFQPGQESAVNGASFDEEQAYADSLKGLRRLTGSRRWR